MPRKSPPTGTDADLALHELIPLLADEEKAIAFLESKRWPNGPVCPHCQAETDAYRIVSKPGAKRPVRPGLWKCKACRKTFTVRVGTVFEESKLPLRTWLGAVHLLTSSKKGISSHQVARQLRITQKTAWFLCHRIREAMSPSGTGLLGGTVEVDESYVGGKPRPRQTPVGEPRPKAKPGRGTSKKPVMLLVERDGRSYARPIERVDAKTLKGEIRKRVDQGSMIVTDEWTSYRGIGKEFEGGHRTVNHGAGEYVRKDEDGTLVTTNTAESWFALLKRSHYGIHHQMSKQHLHRYCNERAFMWDHRKLSDGERLVATLKGAEGKRLRYA